MDFVKSRISFYRQLIQRIIHDEDDEYEVQDQDDSDESDVVDSYNDQPVLPIVKFGPGRAFIGTQELELLMSFEGLKPFGMHKHISMLLIRERISDELKVCVPTNAIWEYVMSRWDPYLADKLEFEAVKIDKQIFDLPKDEEWLQLIEEQKHILNQNDKDKDDFNQATTSYKDIKILKSVKVMVEKLDTSSLLLTGLKCNKLLDCEKTLSSELIDFQTKCSSSNSNFGFQRKLCNNVDLGTDSVKRKLCDNVDLSTDNHLQKTQDRLSTDIMLIKRSRSISSYKYSKPKQNKCAIPTHVSNHKKQIFASSSNSSNLEYSSDTKVNNILLNPVIKNNLKLSSSKELSTFKIKDLKVSKKQKHNNIISSQPTITEESLSYKLRTRSVSSRDISDISYATDTPSRLLRSKVKNFT